MIVAMVATFVDLMVEILLGLLASVLLQSSNSMPHPGSAGMFVLLSTRLMATMNWAMASCEYWPLATAMLMSAMSAVACALVVAQAVKHASDILFLFFIVVVRARVAGRK